MTTSTDQKIAALYIAAFNRAPDLDGLNFWRQVAIDSGLSDMDLMKLMSSGFSEHPSFLEIYGGLGNAAFVDAIYVNVGGKPADDAGKDYWVGLLNGGMTRSDFVAEFCYGVLEITEQQLDDLVTAGDITPQEKQDALDRQAQLTNKTEVALLFTSTLGEASNLDPSTDPLDPASLANDPAYVASQNILKGVNEDPASMAEELAYLNGNPTIEGINEIFGPPDQSHIFVLTPGPDNLTGGDAADTFLAPLQTNSQSFVVNTLNSTDSLDGGTNGLVPVSEHEGGVDQLIATVIPEYDLALNPLAISPNVRSIEKVVLTATGGGNVMINAFQSAQWNMADVEQWWNVGSNSNLMVTNATLNTDVAFVDSAPGVDFEINFLANTLGAPGGDAVNIFFDGAGGGDEGGDLIVGSMTPGNVDPAKRGIEIFHVGVGPNSSNIGELATSGDRLSTVHLMDAGATGDTDVIFRDEFQNLNTFNAAGGSFQLGTEDNPVEIDYTSSPPAVFMGTANVSGSDGGNFFKIELDNGADVALTLNGGDGDDELTVDSEWTSAGGNFSSIDIDAGEGENNVQLADLSGNSIGIMGGDEDDEIELNGITTSGNVDVDFGDGDAEFDLEDSFIGGGVDVMAGNGFFDAWITGSGVNVTGDLNLNVGPGGSEILINDLTTQSGYSGNGDVNITAGDDNGWGNVIDVSGSGIGGSVDIETGDGFSDILLESTTIGGNLDITIGDSSEVSAASAPLVNGYDSYISVGDLDYGDVEEDVVLAPEDFTGVDVGGSVTIESGDGDEQIRLSLVTIGFSLNIDAGDGDNSIELDWVTASGNSIDIDTGSGTDSVDLDNVASPGPVTIDTDGGSDSVSISNGSFTNGFSSNTVDINTGDDGDDVSVSESSFDGLSIDTGDDDAADTVDVDAISLTGDLDIATGGGDDDISVDDTDLSALDADGGAGFDSFTTPDDIATGGSDTPRRFTDIEKLVLARDDGDQSVDMDLLNDAADSDDEVVEQVWAQPSVTGAATTTIDNLASDLGQMVVISNAGLPYPGDFVFWNADTGFVGDVNISTLIDDEADVRTLNVYLDASAPAGYYNESVLAVGELNITDNSIGVASVEVIRLTSTSDAAGLLAPAEVGVNDGPRNAVQFLVAEEAELLRIVGDAELALHIGDVTGGGSGQVDLYSSEDIVDVRADTLEADLALVVLGNDMSEGDGDSYDRLWANPAQTNLLVLYANDQLLTDDDLNIVTGTGPGETSIMGFQRVQFGTSDDNDVMEDLFGPAGGPELAAEGEFDAIAMDRDVVYRIERTQDEDSSAGFTISNLDGTFTPAAGGVSDGADVEVNAPGIDNSDSPDITLEGSGVLNLHLEAPDGDLGDFDGAGTDVDVDINGFGTLNLHIMPNGYSESWLFDLMLDSDLDSLVISGGDPDYDDTLELDDDLPTTIKSIDVSGFAGTFTGGFVPDQQNPGNDVNIFVGEYDIDFTLTELTPPAAPGVATPTTFTLDFNQSGTSGGISGTKEIRAREQPG